MADEIDLVAVFQAFFEEDDITEVISRATDTNVAAAAALFPPTNIPVRVADFVERTVSDYAQQEFREYFRMHRVDFEKLCEWISPSLPKERTVSVEKKVLATLWYLGNKETFRSIGDRFNLSKGSLHHTVHSVCKSLVDKRQDYIEWPSTAEMHQNAENFRQRSGFPGVVGATDGTHIEILGPSERRDSYINRHGFPSLQLQVISNSKLLFLDVYLGWPGSVHDARVFKNSPTGLQLREHGLPRGYHLLGDSAYPLTDYLLVPFRDNGHLSDVEKQFNKAHSSTRVEVERAIGLLKGKFRKLKYLEMASVQDACTVIAAACVLHNFLIVCHGVDEEDIDRTNAPSVEEELEGGSNDTVGDKRMEIAHMLA